jgi:adenylate cyclase
MGLGVNTGPVTAGNNGSSKRMDYTVIGDSVNLSSRLCANAAGAQILISESTFQLLDGSFPARRLDPIRVKGKESQIQVYEILWNEIPTAAVTLVVGE